MVTLSTEKLRKAELAVVEAQNELAKERTNGEENERAKASHILRRFSLQLSLLFIFLFLT